MGLTSSADFLRFNMVWHHAGGRGGFAARREGRGEKEFDPHCQTPSAVYTSCNKPIKLHVFRTKISRNIFFIRIEDSDPVHGPNSQEKHALNHVHSLQSALCQVVHTEDVKRSSKDRGRGESSLQNRLSSGATGGHARRRGRNLKSHFL